VTTIVDHPGDDLAVFAVDALDGPARAALELHLAGCPVCRHELHAFREALALTVVDEAPPTAVWDAIVTELGLPPIVVVPLDPAEAHVPLDWPAAFVPVDLDPADLDKADLDPADLDKADLDGVDLAPEAEADVVPLAPRRPRHLHDAAIARSRRVVVAALAAAAAVVVAVGVLPQVWDGPGDRGPGSGQVASLPVGEITASDGTEIANLRADDDGSYVELTDAAGRLPASEVLQLWDTSRRVPVSLGLLGTGEQTDVRVTVPADTTRVAISREEAGGAAMPGVIVGQGSVAVA
jgi:hypothetical protein